ncbi:MAG: carbon-nitrogen hydrolase family protein [Planctomycetaceae bacterium]|nr:carbon-nitrogen hydrolase family protein [Planctomycetaceae bacterium]
MAIDSYYAGLAQILVEGGRPAANLDRAVNAIHQAATLDCRLVVLPECLDLGWTDPSARELAQPIPGPHVDRLARAARDAGVYVAAGLVERSTQCSAQRLYNAAVLLAPTGELLLHYRKINELDIALDLYSVGDRLAVAHTELGAMGLNICADNFDGSLAIGHTLARMGAQVIVSPSAWAVDDNHDQAAVPYGQLWRDAYGKLTALYDLTIIGVSNVGQIRGGPWQGRKCIGCSLAMGKGGTILAQGPYGEEAAALVRAEVRPQPPIARGTDVAVALKERGYDGP